VIAQRLCPARSCRPDWLLFMLRRGCLAKALGIGRASGVGSHVLSVLSHNYTPASILEPCVGYAIFARERLSDDSCYGAPWEIVYSVVGVEMATEPKKQRFSQRHRQVLEVLAMAPEGRGVNDLLTLGFKLETIADLIRTELATVRLETTESHDSRIEIARVRIADAGWRALEGLTTRRRSPPRPNGR